MFAPLAERVSEMVEAEVSFGDAKITIRGPQEFVTGEVTVKLYKGQASVIARTSPFSLYSMDLVTFEEGSGTYDHHDAEGFIKLNGLRLRTYAARSYRK